eukprot:TRINITY_DN2909_c0_g1_i3.p1 TRINITY_DN2909_c0_g1~~TRINITY_DN2909_c0_g1_i3.p1  ORF type:complete len:479 (+),score=132.73 TRINITY_DN2909_c0_g1_i3:77-1513(+)
MFIFPRFWRLKQEFYSPLLREGDFDKKPIVLMLGQYSVGKTSFIEYVLGKSFPGQRIGPEPTTDRFVAVTYGQDERVIPGNALAVDDEKPFYALNKFGNAFLSKFEASVVDSELLKNCDLIDTPGVLAGEQQRLGRSYDFVEVVEWFAEKADMILLLFDAHKLDISDEFKRTIEVLKGNDDKIRIVLNKSDTVSQQQLMRVYGALMWSLGKVVKTPEVMRVYISSFWDKDYQIQDNAKLFDMERRDLLNDLYGLPRDSAVRKVNELVKRTRLARVHCAIIAHLKGRMPAIFGKDSKKAELLRNLENEFKDVQKNYRLPPGDFPSAERYRQILAPMNFSDFPKFSERLFRNLDEALSVDLPRLMNMIAPPKVHKAPVNPFDDDSNWVVSSLDKENYTEVFMDLNPKNGRLSGSQAKNFLVETGIPKNYLRSIWSLCDIEGDGSLDLDEFCLALWMVEFVKRGGNLPGELPIEMIPPSKR